MSVRGAFWRFAHERYQARKPSLMFEYLMIGWGVFWLSMFVLSFFTDFVRTTSIVGALMFAGLPLAIGLLHRPIRIEKASAPDALYRKRLAPNG